MQSRMLAASSAALLIASAGTAVGGFTPSEWTISSFNLANPTFPGSGGITISEDKMLLVEPDTGEPNSGWLATWSNTGGGVISFDWFAIQVDIGFGSFGYVINGTYTALSSGSGSGSVVLNLSVGDVFEFRVDTSDGIFGSNSYSVMNFVPAPGAIALLGMAGVTGARRRRR